MLGEDCVGKTSLLRRYIDRSFSFQGQATLAIDYFLKTVSLPSGGIVNAQFWDNPGQKICRKLVYTYFRGSIGAFLIYDVTNKNSFLECKNWMEKFRKKTEANAIIMLVANKKDIDSANEELRKITYDQGLNFAINNGLLFKETSARTGFNVDEVFELLLEVLYQRLHI